jgi:plastocyanin
MDGLPHRPRRIRGALTLIAAAAAALAAPGGASATETTETFRVPITVSGYEVKQTAGLVQHPSVSGHVTKMEANIVDDNGDPVPIQRLMLHHAVFLNASKQDATCQTQGILSFDNLTSAPAAQRFYALGEERAKLAMPDGYGYEHQPSDYWVMLYMVMNHQSTTDSAFIEYKVTIDDDPELQDVDPYWFDARNCRADPIYNVPGTGRNGSTDVERTDYVMPESGRIVAGGGHVHGGARDLRMTQPECDNREVANSVPTWGQPDHPFYNVRPILHEPGPDNMSAFRTEDGIPVEAGQTLRLNSRYDNSRPHTRVMGIFIIYVAPDAGVTDGCGPLPTDKEIVQTDYDGRAGPVPFRVPLTGLDENDQAIEIDAPPGKLRRMRSGSTIDVGDRFFERPNVKIDQNERLNWNFGGSELHNLTLANGPEAIGSPNLDRNRSFGKRFKRPGTYRMFCALHPVQMAERVVVKRKRR